MYKNYAAVDFEEIDMTTGLLPAASFAEASKARASFFGSRANFGAIAGGHGVHRRFFAGRSPWAVIRAPWRKPGWKSLVLQGPWVYCRAFTPPENGRLNWTGESNDG